MSSAQRTLASSHADTVVALAHLKKALALPPSIGAPPIAIHNCTKPRRQKAGNEISHSNLRPHVLAHDRLRVWSAPSSDNFRLSILNPLPLNDVLHPFDVMLISVELKTRENYGARLLRFHQYCDLRHILENCRMPASDHLLALFIASWAGKVAITTAQNWLVGLHFWHNLHGAPWLGHTILRTATAGLRKVVTESLKRPRHPPVTLEHMHALFCGLDLSNVFDVSVLAVTSTAFWSCCRLGELILVNVNAFDVSHHISCSSSFNKHSPPEGVSYSVLHLPWTKTTHAQGANIIASKIDNVTNTFTAINHHLLVNSSVPLDAPFFAYETANGGWSAMTKPWFLAHCNHIWHSANLLELMGHCFHIGGATELLLCGVPLDIVAIQGHWKSRAFLEYWRKIESILPLFVTSSVSDSQAAMLNSSMDSYARRYS
ncbi:DNA breaking-rejoining enzyme [Suillus placidus]|uniref:DNA breaking-rejoining enzyme n=1 Tax=Suillus placidus TaxID=48579 RepID=A0A9P6ZVN8_9AGAM|nr:DNA breaking-rejoining enzyme [Suillus placidus]